MTTPANFEIDRKANFPFSGYKERLGKLCSKVDIEDKLVFYIIGTRSLGAICTVTSRLYIDRTPHWAETDEVWPCRFNLKPDIVLPEGKMLDVVPLVPSLSFVTQKQKQSNWGTAFMGSLKIIPEQDFHFIEQEMRRLLEEPKKTRGSYHDQISEMLYEIGQMEGRASEKEYRIDGERIDVAWKKIAAGNPYAVFEVQIGGNFYEALAKLKHAWDKWNSRPFLVTSEQYRGKALAWVSGSFHEMQGELRIMDCEKVKELYEAAGKVKNLRAELGIS
jgi:hypothetical protein